MNQLHSILGTRYLPPHHFFIFTPSIKLVLPFTSRAVGTLTWGMFFGGEPLLPWDHTKIWKSWELKYCLPLSVNKGCCSRQEPWGNSGWRQTGCPLSSPPSSQPLQPPPKVRLRKLRMRKHRKLAPDSWGEDQRNDFSEPRLLHLPIHRKALNSLTWDNWFSFINSNLLFRIPGVAKTPLYPGFPPSFSE